MPNLKFLTFAVIQDRFEIDKKETGREPVLYMKSSDNCKPSRKTQKFNQSFHINCMTGRY